MSMTYTTFLLRLAQSIGPVGEGINWAVASAAAIDAAEQRIYRELDLLGAMVGDSTFTCVANSRNFTLTTPASGRITVVHAMNIITPVGSNIDNGTLNPLIP